MLLVMCVVMCLFVCVYVCVYSSAQGRYKCGNRIQVVPDDVRQLPGHAGYERSGKSRVWWLIVCSL